MVLPLSPQSVTKVASGLARPGTVLGANQRVYRLVDHLGIPIPYSTISTTPWTRPGRKPSPGGMASGAKRNRPWASAWR